MFFFSSFRRQHEQLRSVISRVLRPALSQESEEINGPQTNQVAQRNGLDAGLDVADANAIEVFPYLSYLSFNYSLTQVIY